MIVVIVCHPSLGPVLCLIQCHFETRLADAGQMSPSAGEMDATLWLRRCPLNKRHCIDPRMRGFVEQRAGYIGYEKSPSVQRRIQDNWKPPNAQIFDMAIYLSGELGVNLDVATPPVVSAVERAEQASPSAWQTARSVRK